MQAEITKVCKSVFGDEGTVADLSRLSGGANMETWAFDFGRRALILRRMPLGAESSGALDADGVSIETEAAIIELASKYEVRVPTVHHVLRQEDGLGRGFIMERVVGEALPKRIQQDVRYSGVRRTFVKECASQLAKIHQIPVSEAPTELTRFTSGDAVESLRRVLEDFFPSSAVATLGIRWLEENVPTSSVKLSLLHGDFRLGNLLVDESSVCSILDWELVHLGDPVQDLAYLCSPTWRFGSYLSPVAGLGEINELFSSYEAASGERVDKSRFNFWLVYSTLWWIGVCVKMSTFWRTRIDRSLERAVVGRRASEGELDLLLLVEEILGIDARKLDWTLPDQIEPTGNTTGWELAKALLEWIRKQKEDQKASGRAAFEFLVAANAAGMLERRVRLGEEFSNRDAHVLSRLGVSASDMVCRIRDSENIIPPDAIVSYLRQTCIQAVSIDQPSYPGLEIAKARWVNS